MAAPRGRQNPREKAEGDEGDDEGELNGDGEGCEKEEGESKGGNEADLVGAAA